MMRRRNVLLIALLPLLLLWLGLAGLSAMAAPTAQADAGALITAEDVVTLPWSAQGSDNITQVQGQVTYDGQPVVGAVVSVAGYRLPNATDGEGHFTFPADHTVVRRYPVAVTDTSNATINGAPLNEPQQEALAAAQGGINVHYAIGNLMTAVQADGTVAITGKAQFGNGDAPPPVVLYSYRLTGTVTTTAGEPVRDVMISTNSPEFRWTFSDPTGARGIYTSLYWPTEAAPFRVLVVEHEDTYGIAGDEGARFPLYESSRMDVTLDRATGTITVTEPISIAGDIYDGLLVGLLQDGVPVTPISVTWPTTTTGQFHMVLPADYAGATLQWWQDEANYFSTIAAEPGGPISVGDWPQALTTRTPRGFATVTLPPAE